MNCFHLIGPILLSVLLKPSVTVARSIVDHCSHDKISILPKSKLRIIRNKIYARFGKPFKDPILKKNFAKYSWYKIDPQFSFAKVPQKHTDCAMRILKWEQASHRLWTESADLDGDGKKEKIFLITGKDPANASPTIPDKKYRYSSSWLFVDEAEISLQIHWRPGDYWYKVEEPYKVIDIMKDSKIKHILIQSHLPEDEDPPIESNIVSFKNSKLIKSTLKGAYSDNSGKLTFPKPGIVKLSKGGCPSYLTVLYRMKDEGYLEKIKEIKSANTALPGGVCPACPFVYVLYQGSWRKQGEILRNLNRPDLQDWQSLDLDIGEIHTLHVRISEEKDEVSFLDAVRLVANGRAYLPQNCQIMDEPYCSEDSEFFIIPKGKFLDLKFQLRESSSKFRLEATGYYELNI